jgi:hypothetical protein
VVDADAVLNVDVDVSEAVKLVLVAEIVVAEETVVV